MKNSKKSIIKLITIFVIGIMIFLPANAKAVEQCTYSHGGKTFTLRIIDGEVRLVKGSEIDVYPADNEKSEINKYYAEQFKNSSSCPSVVVDRYNDKYILRKSTSNCSGVCTRESGNRNIGAFDEEKNSDCSADYFFGTGEDSLGWLLIKLYGYMKVIAPMIFLVMSAIDFSKSIVNSDEETMKKNYKKLIKRLFALAILYFVPLLIAVILELFGIVKNATCIFR